jgi:crossover junction endodeoxyribonuclease RuvC
MRVLGIDPSLRSTGYGLVEESAEGGKLRALDYGHIANKAALRGSSCLLAIREQLGDVIARHEPDCVAVEGVIYVQSVKTAIMLGAARGAALLAAAHYGLEIFEYAPKRVKQSVTGSGSAEKPQVAFMVRALLGLTETPQADAADALAIAITHLRMRKSFANGLEQPVTV